LAFAAVGVGLGLTAVSHRQAVPTCSVPGTFAELMALDAVGLEGLDIARLNLLCAEGLPGAEVLDVEASLATLDAMAGRVGAETQRHAYRFQQDPAEYEGSEGFFRMLMMAVVLAEDFGVRYNPAKGMNAAQAYTGDGFFADSRDVFLNGLTGERRLGTCSSLPVLHVAVGRRLGYPLKLVATKGHLFVRWEDERERFNVEVTGQGLNRFEDDYYRRWPVAVTEAEVRSEGYLKSMTPTEELAAFLCIRGLCWQEAGNAQLAAESFCAAARLAPGVRSYQMMLARLEPMPSVE
jgi:hypothetical protein